MAKEKRTTKKLGNTAMKVHFFSPENERIDLKSAHIYQVVSESGGVKTFAWEFIHSKRAVSIAVVFVLVLSLIARPVGLVIVDLFRGRTSDSIFAVEGDEGTTLYDGEEINVGTAAAINIGMSESSRFVKVSSGPTHTLAIDQDGQLFAWGSDQYGQIGDGISEAAHTDDCESGNCVVSPLNLSIITGVDFPNILYGKKIIDISAGNTHSLAVDDEGNLYAWGDNREGQIGDGTGTLNHSEDNKVLAPVHIQIVDPSSRVRRKTTAISAADGFSTAVDDIGNFYAWGRNSDHELGDNTTESKDTPVALTRDRANPLHGKKIKETRATRRHTTVTTEDDKTYTWGKSDYQIPIPVETDADTSDLSSIDTDDDTLIKELKKEAELPSDVAQVSVADDYGSAVTSSGDLYTWGSEDNAGTACTTYMPSAVRINGLATEHVPCNAILIDHNTETAQKTVSLTTLSQPSQNILAQPGAININSINPSEITIGEEKVVVVSGSGFLPGNVVVSKIAANYHHSMAVDSSGVLYAWGINEHSEIGTGNSASASTPVKITGLNGSTTNDITAGTRISEVAAGVYFSLATDTDGRLYAWGYNSKGQLGVGSTTSVRAPKLVNGNGSIGSGTRITAISAGYFHSIALDSGGTIHSWGDNSYGQMGNGATGGTQNTPVTVSIGSSAKAVSAGNYFSLAVSGSGSPYAWGRNTFNSVAPTNGVVSSPRQISGGDLPGNANITSIAGGNAHGIMSDSAGNIYTWGFGSNGQIGLGNTSDAKNPVRVNGQGQLPGSLSVAKVVAGSSDSYALDQNGKIYGWGSNGYGAVGIGVSDGPDVLSPSLINGSSGGAQNDTHSGTRIADIASGSAAIHAIAISDTGALYAWGNDNFNQIGDNRSLLSSSKNGVYTVAAPRQISGFGALASATSPVAVSLDGKPVSADISESSVSFNAKSDSPKTSNVTISNGQTSDSTQLSFVEKKVDPPTPPDPSKPKPIPPTAEEKPIVDIPNLPSVPSTNGSGGDKVDYSDPKWTFTSTEQRVGISPSLDKGYKLYLSSSTPELRSPGLPDISPTSGTLEEPKKLDLGTWGFALSKKDIFVPPNNFDDSYSPQTANNRYAGISTAPLLVYDSPDPIEVVRLYYGIRASVAGIDVSKYATIITFTIISN